QETPEVDEVEAVEVELTRSLVLESMSVLLELLLEGVLDSVEVELVLSEEFEDVELVLLEELDTEPVLELAELEPPGMVSWSPGYIKCEDSPFSLFTAETLTPC